MKLTCSTKQVCKKTQNESLSHVHRIKRLTKECYKLIILEEFWLSILNYFLQVNPTGHIKNIMQLWVRINFFALYFRRVSIQCAFLWGGTSSAHQRIKLFMMVANTNNRLAINLIMRVFFQQRERFELSLRHSLCLHIGVWAWPGIYLWWRLLC